jgi:hypothetical protein
VAPRRGRQPRSVHFAPMLPSAFALVVAAAEASALTRARAVAAKAPPEVTHGSRTGGEHEAAAWWDEHDELFSTARAEWGPRHHELYDFDAHEHDFIDPGLRAAVSAAESAAASGRRVDEETLRAHLHPTSVPPGVYRLRVFTPRFCQLLVEELRHMADSGVPIRRPNGMNRYGAILEVCVRVAHAMGAVLALPLHPSPAHGHHSLIPPASPSPRARGLWRHSGGREFPLSLAVATASSLASALSLCSTPPPSHPDHPSSFPPPGRARGSENGEARGARCASLRTPASPDDLPTLGGRQRRQQSLWVCGRLPAGGGRVSRSARRCVSSHSQCETWQSTVRGRRALLPWPAHGG